MNQHILHDVPTQREDEGLSVLPVSICLYETYKTEWYRQIRGSADVLLFIFKYNVPNNGPHYYSLGIFLPVQFTRIDFIFTQFLLLLEYFADFRSDGVSHGQERRFIPLGSYSK